MTLDELRYSASVCKLCDLHSGRKKPVFDKGNANSHIMIIGMVPAYDENNAGIPFVGKAGKLLDVILYKSSLSLQDVYITNLVKCFLAPGNDLDSKWVESCFPYLIVQINLIKPLVILTLGIPATVNLLGIDTKIPMKDMRGRVFSYNGIDVVPTYHPSYLIRGGGEKHKNFDDVLEDFDLVNYIVSDKERKFE